MRRHIINHAPVSTVNSGQFISDGEELVIPVFVADIGLDDLTISGENLFEGAVFDEDQTVRTPLYSRAELYEGIEFTVADDRSRIGLANGFAGS